MPHLLGPVGPLVHIKPCKAALRYGEAETVSCNLSQVSTSSFLATGCSGLCFILLPAGKIFAGFKMTSLPLLEECSAHQPSGPLLSCWERDSKKQRQREERPWMSFPEKREKSSPCTVPKWKGEAQKRKEMRSDFALSQFLQSPSIPVTECLWSGEGETLNEVLKAPGSLHHPLGCQLP